MEQIQTQINRSLILNDDIELFSDEDIDYNIALERNLSIHEISQDVENLSEIMFDLSNMVNDQGEVINDASKNIDNSVIATNAGVRNLERANEYVKDRLIIIRDIAFVVGGGILGTTGFLLGPIVGLGTIIAGVAGGGAAVAGMHKADQVKLNQVKLGQIKLDQVK